MWGVADFLGGNQTKRLPVALVVGLSQFFGLLTAVGFSFIIGWEWDTRAVPWAMISSLSGYAGLMFFYKALAIGRMGIVSPIASLGAIVPVAAGLLAGDSPSAWQIIGIVVAIVGIVLASGPELSGGADAKPVFLAIGTAIGFGFCLWAIAKGSEFSVMTTMVGMRAQTVVLAAIAIVVTKSYAKVNLADGVRLSAIGALDILANVTFGYASTAGMLSIVAVLGSIYPVFTVLLAWWLLKERLMPVQYAGVVAALMGVAAISAC